MNDDPVYSMLSGKGGCENSCPSGQQHIWQRFAYQGNMSNASSCEDYFSNEVGFNPYESCCNCTAAQQGVGCVASLNDDFECVRKCGTATWSLASGPPTNEVGCDGLLNTYYPNSTTCNGIPTNQSC